MPDDRAADTRPVILLIDDDGGVRDSLALLLETHGYRVITARDGRRGIAAFGEHRPAVVVTDILMPEQDGIGAIREMRRLNPNTKIIAMSGGGKVDKADYLTVAEQLGADIGIEKAHLDQLLTILPKLLGQD